MKILLAAKHTPVGPMKIGGVQSWIETVANVFERHGHTVHIAEPNTPPPDPQYDFGVFAHVGYTSHMACLCKRVKYISHGTIPDEQPVFGAGDDWLFTSEEVRGNWPGEVLRQPIDLDYWTPGNQKRDTLTMFSYRGNFPELATIAMDMGLRFQRIYRHSKDECREYLQRAKVVVATGRAALEAMACGCHVVIADRRPYQMPLIDYDTVGSMHRNYSGRGGVKVTRGTLTEGIVRALERGPMVDHVKRHHDAGRIVHQLC
jgi:hypothetical protein